MTGNGEYAPLLGGEVYMFPGKVGEMSESDKLFTYQHELTKEVNGGFKLNFA